MRRGVVLLTALAIGSIVAGQTNHQSGRKSQAVSPHDLSGTWVGPDPQKPGPRFQEVFSPLSDVPPMTPWGQARYNAAKPGFGPRANLNGNDPTLRCDPQGVPRIMTWITPMEIIQTPGQIVELFEEFHEWRQIWTDGRKFPSDLYPTWNGYSIGKWEGNTLVVDTIGFNDKTWVDQYGDPHSDAMRLVEHYTKVNRDTLKLSMTIYDPKAYTKPWVSATRSLTLQPNLTIQDEPCVPEELQTFTQSVRVPARAKPKK